MHHSVCLRHIRPFGTMRWESPESKRRSLIFALPWKGSYSVNISEKNRHANANSECSNDGRRNDAAHHTE